MKYIRAALAIVATTIFAGILALASTAPAAAPALPAEKPMSAPLHTADPRPVAPTEAPPSRVARPRVTGMFRVPIAGAALPEDPDVLPGSERAYRTGVHEGIDFAAAAGTPAVAAAAGTVARADHEYVEWTDAERERALDEARLLGYTPERTLDRIRGRQVWIDHGRGVVTRYAHLESTEAGLRVGDAVAEGTVIGAVGSSGLPASGPHLHFEVRLGESYLGEGLRDRELARAIRAAFR